MTSWRWLLRGIGSLLLLLVFAVIGGFYIFIPWGQQKVDFDPAKKECFSGGSKTPWKACIYTAKQGTNGDIAYYLHGIRWDENRWGNETNYTAQIQGVWAAENAKPPLVVAVSFGPVWLMTPPGLTKSNAYLSVFTDEIIPLVEKKMGRPRVRELVGESMGGLNSLLVAFKTQGLFKKVASLCPPLYRDSPYAPFSEVLGFLRRTGADPKIMLSIHLLIGDYVTSEREWSEMSPVSLVEKDLPEPMPEIYLSGNLYDRYGNFEGAQYFAKRAIARGIRLHWRPLYGNHCAVDPVSVADFLLN